jgi:hypothetical protein
MKEEARKEFSEFKKYYLFRDTSNENPYYTNNVDEYFFIQELELEQKNEKEKRRVDAFV